MSSMAVRCGACPSTPPYEPINGKVAWLAGDAAIQQFPGGIAAQARRPGQEKGADEEFRGTVVPSNHQSNVPEVTRSPSEQSSD